MEVQRGHPYDGQQAPREARKTDETHMGFRVAAWSVKAKVTAHTHAAIS